MDKGDAYIFLPGGVGTYEEFFEVLSSRVMKKHNKPIGLLNHEGFFDPLIHMIKHGVKEKFISTSVMDMIIIGTTPNELLKSVLRKHEELL
jgi:uncharacterized protein (TIGR00730 family)